MYPDLKIVLTELINKAQKILGSNFIGAYLQGSLAVGDFDYNSDVDFIIVIKEELSKQQVHALEEMHNEIYYLDNRWAKRLEYSYFPQKILRKIPAHRDKLWYFDNGHRNIELSDHCNTIVVRVTVREKGIVLAGPDPKTLIDPISPDALRAEIKDTMIEWGEEILKNPKVYENRFYQSYLVLNYCRMLHDFYTGTVGSKLAGVKWAKENLDPEWIGLIDFCWQERLDPQLSVTQPADPTIFPNVLNFVRYVIGKCGVVE
jgi:predicted nucleotidyltransferase